MQQEDEALYAALPSTHPFRIVIRKQMVEFYYAHGTEIQRRAFHAFLLLLLADKIPATGEDWKAFATCDQPDLLQGNAYQAVSLFWAKVADMSTRALTPAEAKEVIQTNQDVFPTFWDSVWKNAYVVVIAGGWALWWVLQSSWAVTRGLWQGFWFVAPTIYDAILASMRGLVDFAYGLRALPGALAEIVGPIAALRAPVLAGNYAWANAWSAAPYALFVYVMRRVLRAYSLLREGISADPQEAFVVEAGDVFSIEAQVKELDTEMIQQFRNSLSDELGRTYQFRQPTTEELARLEAYNRELTARGEAPRQGFFSEGEPISSEVIDVETIYTTRPLPKTLEERHRIQQIQKDIRPTVERKAAGVLTADEINAAIRNEAHDRWLLETGQPRSELNELPASAYKEFRLARSAAMSEYPVAEPVPRHVITDLGRYPEMREPMRLMQRADLEMRLVAQDLKLSEAEYKALAEEISLEQQRLQNLAARDEANFRVELKLAQEREISTEGGLNVANARRIVLREVYNRLETGSRTFYYELQPEKPLEALPPELLEELALEEKTFGVGVGADIPLEDIALRPEVIPEAPALGRFNAITAANIERLCMGAQLVGAVVLLIIGIVAHVQDEAARQEAQDELNKQANAYQQEFDALSLALQVIVPEEYHNDLRGTWDFDEAQPRTRIPALFIYGEAGLHYLQFRKDFPSLYPSVLDGLAQVRELWGLLSAGYLRATPSFSFGLLSDKAELYSMDWRDALQYYLNFADERRSANWSTFRDRYLALLQKHGDDPNLEINFVRNQPFKYWSTFFEVSSESTPQPFWTPGLFSKDADKERAKTIQNAIEQALPLLLCYLRFERNRTEPPHANHRYTEPTNALPDPRFIAYHWYHDTSVAAPQPVPQIPSLVAFNAFSSGVEASTQVFRGTGLTRFGSVTVNADGSLVAYSVPSLSLIVLATGSNMALLTPPTGAPTEIGGLACDVLPIAYKVLQGTITLGFDKQTVTFVGTEVTRVQIGSDVYIPVAPRSYQQPTNKFFDFRNLPAGAGMAYMVLLNHDSIVQKLNTVSSLTELHPEWVPFSSDYANNQAFAYGSGVGLLQSDGPQGAWQITVKYNQTLVNIRSVAYTAAFAAFIVGFGMSENPELFLEVAQGAKEAFIVSVFSPLRQVVNQYVTTPLTTYLAANEPMEGWVASLSSAESWQTVGRFASYTLATAQNSAFYMYSTYVNAPLGKVVPIMKGLGSWIANPSFPVPTFVNTLSSLTTKLQVAVETLKAAPSAEVFVRTGNAIREVQGFAQNAATASSTVLGTITSPLRTANNAVISAGEALLARAELVDDAFYERFVAIGRSAVAGGIAIGGGGVALAKYVGPTAAAVIAPLIAPLVRGGEELFKGALQVAVAVGVGLITLVFATSSGSVRKRRRSE